jgi:hemerythrin-like domain-containing protein
MRATACFCIQIQRGTNLGKASIQIIHDEHIALASMLRSIDMMVTRGPGSDPQNYFDVMRAMLFYIDEFPERLHHPKETELLFPAVARLAPDTREAIARLDKDHVKGEAAVRELQYFLLAWELIGESRREVFEAATKRYVAFYLAHMRLEETVILPAALKVLSDADWRDIDAAFETNCDPLTGQYPRDPVYDRLFTRIVNLAPAPIGLGEGD